MNQPHATKYIDSARDSEKLYHAHLQGDFYGKAYYRKRDSERESAIVYSDDEDKRLFSYILKDYFTPKRVLEIGCAMGYLIRQLLPFGMDVYGIDFSEYCVKNVPQEIRHRVKHADLLALPFRDAQFHMLVGLDILEHLPESLLEQAIRSIHRVLAPGGIYFGVIPAYGENKYGPMVFDYRQRESWIVDAQAGRPFRDIPLDVQGKPHMGHLIHATVQWWEERFQALGFRRLGALEAQIHAKYDEKLDRGRWGIFIFQKQQTGFYHRFRHAEVVSDLWETAAIKPPSGFYSWEFWPGQGWVRWTKKTAHDTLTLLKGDTLQFHCYINHPDCSAAHPVMLSVDLAQFPLLRREIRRCGRYTVLLPVPKVLQEAKSRRVVLRLAVNRTFTPSHEPDGDRRQLGVAISPITQCNNTLLGNIWK